MKKKKIKTKKVQVKKSEILEYYYMIPADINVKQLSSDITCVDADKIERWNELDLMEIILTADSLIFQNALEAFEDPEDLEFLKEHNIKTVYQISYDAEDESLVKEIFTQLLSGTGGMLCSDTEDFSPVWHKETIGQFPMA